MNWFKKRDKAQIRVIHSTEISIDDWRRSKELVGYARKLMAAPEFRTILSMLRNEGPSSYGMTGGSHDDHIAHAYRGEGYNLALNNLESLANMKTGVDQLEATFEPEPGREPT